jgi:hypothetical protein
MCYKVVQSQYNCSTFASDILSGSRSLVAHRAVAVAVSMTKFMRVLQTVRRSSSLFYGKVHDGARCLPRVARAMPAARTGPRVTSPSLCSAVVPL